jgi:hypothetical protein
MNQRTQVAFTAFWPSMCAAPPCATCGRSGPSPSWPSTSSRSSIGTTKPLQCHTRQIDAFNANLQSMDGSGMGQDHLDDADFDADRHGSCALVCALAAILDQLVTIQVPDLLFPEVALEGCECRRLAASGWFPYGAHIGYMKVNQVTESVQAGHGRSVGRKPLIDQGLGLARPFLGVVTAQERLARVAALSSDLDPVSTGGKLGDRGHFRVRYVCSESSKQGIFGAIRA